MSYNYDYARLGNSCQTSLDVLVDNRKFLAPNDLVYNLMYTRMKRYPLYPTTKEQDIISDDERVYLDDGKIGKESTQDENKEAESENKVPELPAETYSCCGRR
jgi:hypothetical protein